MQKKESPLVAGGTVVTDATPAEQIDTEPNLTAKPAVSTIPNSAAKWIDRGVQVVSIHPLAEKFPTMLEKDFAELKESIRQYGLFEPITINDRAQILDGRHRYRALTELGLFDPYRMAFFNPECLSGISEEQFIYDSNIHRRHLTDDQRVMLAAAFVPYFRKEGEENKGVGAGRPKGGNNLDPNSGPDKKRDLKSKKANSTAGKVAAKAGVSIHKAEQAIMIEDNAPELTRVVTSGELPLKEAAKEAESRTDKKAKPKKIFNGGIKTHSTRNVRKETTFEEFVSILFEGVMDDVILEFPDKTKADVIKIICS